MRVVSDGCDDEQSEFGIAALVNPRILLQKVPQWRRTLASYTCECQGDAALGRHFCREFIAVGSTDGTHLTDPDGLWDYISRMRFGNGWVVTDSCLSNPSYGFAPQVFWAWRVLVLPGLRPDNYLAKLAQASQKLDGEPIQVDAVVLFGNPQRANSCDLPNGAVIVVPIFPEKVELEEMLKDGRRRKGEMKSIEEEKLGV